MSVWQWLVVAVFAFGLFSARSALSTTSQSKPPIRWKDLPVVFALMGLGFGLLSGMQLLRRDPERPRFMYRMAILITLYFSGSGLGSIGLAAIGGSVQPHAFMLLSIGMGGLAGLWAVRVAFRRRFGVAP